MTLCTTTKGPNLSDGDETEGGGGGCQGNARRRDEVVALVALSRRLDSFLLLGFIALMAWISEIRLCTQREL